jgi:hypothetical protein
MSGAIPPLSNTPSWRGAQLKGRRGTTLYFTILDAKIKKNNRNV